MLKKLILQAIKIVQYGNGRRFWTNASSKGSFSFIKQLLSFISFETLLFNDFSVVLSLCFEANFGRLFLKISTTKITGGVVMRILWIETIRLVIENRMKPILTSSAGCISSVDLKNMAFVSIVNIKKVTRQASLCTRVKLLFSGLIIIDNQRWLSVRLFWICWENNILKSWFCPHSGMILSILPSSWSRANHCSQRKVYLQIKEIVILYTELMSYHYNSNKCY